MQKASSRPSSSPWYRERTVATSASERAVVTILVNSAPKRRQRPMVSNNSSREGVPSKSWKERMKVVPASRQRCRRRLPICGGASTSRSTKRAPASMALVSRRSASAGCISPEMRQVATSGLSVREKTSRMSSSDKGQRSSRISAISTSGRSRMRKMSSFPLPCRETQIMGGR